MLDYGFIRNNKQIMNDWSQGVMKLLFMFACFLIVPCNSQGENRTFRTQIVGFQENCARGRCRYTGRFHGYFWLPAHVEKQGNNCTAMVALFCTRGNCLGSNAEWTKYCKIWDVCQYDGDCERSGNGPAWPCRCTFGNPSTFDVWPGFVIQRYFRMGFAPDYFARNKETYAWSDVFDVHAHPDDWDPIEKLKDIQYSTSLAGSITIKMAAVIVACLVQMVA
ncbi:uncharacterized protein LOC131932165 [Physella acuta]|uniref:uncharacterized protein LOC131932165 n=1 Tax=Physella acuta TaxID=109671 RepID=UPI0027DB26EB|nr:uncharacterized protein LOC131932165 [Physella acuta]